MRVFVGAHGGFFAHGVVIKIEFAVVNIATIIGFAIFEINNALPTVERGKAEVHFYGVRTTKKIIGGAVVELQTAVFVKHINKAFCVV